jgi:hypothetical protein
MTEDNLLADLPAAEPQNYLAELVGEGKKFRDTEALAKGKYEADAFIALKNKQFDSLSSDYLKLREEAQTRAKLEDLLAQLDEKQLSSSRLPTAKEEPRELPTQKPEDIQALVSREIAKNELARQQQANLNVVKAKLTERFGDNYAPAVRERIEALGLTEQRFNEWAREAPQAVINALGTEQPRETFQSPPRTNRTFKPVTEQKRTWTYYQELKKNNPKLYSDPKIMNQMLQDAEELGPAFEDGDFHSR